MIGAVVLAAGAGSRMGRDKATLRVSPDGPTFVEAIEAALCAAGIEEVRVVVAPGSGRQRSHEVVNPDLGRGSRERRP